MKNQEQHFHRDLWEQLTSADEYRPRLLDRYDRPLPGLSSRDLLKAPVSKHFVNNGFHPEYPDGRPFAVCISHDIDSLYRYETTGERARACVKAIARIPRAPRKSLEDLAEATQRKVADEWRIERLLEIEHKIQANSTFFLLALQPGDRDFNYEVSETKGIMETIKASGNELGLHGGHEAFNNHKQLEIEKLRLEKQFGSTLQGYRSHYLRFQVPETWRILERCHFAYDSTLSFAHCAGFRTGLCHPYRPYDREQRRYLNVFEVPLILMDGSTRDYMRLDTRGATDLFRILISEVKACRGVLMVLWHNTCVSDEIGVTYQRLLDLLVAEGAWLTSTSRLLSWWQAKGFDKQVQEMSDDLRRDGEEC